MGAGVAEVAATAGIEVTCWGRSEESTGRARSAVERSTQKATEKGKLSSQDRGQLLQRIEYTASLDALAETDVVVEAVAEDLELKRSLFAELDRVVKPNAVLATATSSLSIIDIAAATGNPELLKQLIIQNYGPEPTRALASIGHAPFAGGWDVRHLRARAWSQTL